MVVKEELSLEELESVTGGAGRTKITYSISITYKDSAAFAKSKTISYVSRGQLNQSLANSVARSWCSNNNYVFVSCSYKAKDAETSCI